MNSYPSIHIFLHAYLMPHNLPGSAYIKQSLCNTTKVTIFPNASTQNYTLTMFVLMPRDIFLYLCTYTHRQLYVGGFHKHRKYNKCGHILRKCVWIYLSSLQYLILRKMYYNLYNVERYLYLRVYYFIPFVFLLNLQMYNF